MQRQLLFWLLFGCFCVWLLLLGGAARTHAHPAEGVGRRSLSRAGRIHGRASEGIALGDWFQGVEAPNTHHPAPGLCSRPSPKLMILHPPPNPPAHPRLQRPPRHAVHFWPGQRRTWPCRPIDPLTSQCSGEGGRGLLTHPFLWMHNIPRYRALTTPRGHIAASLPGIAMHSIMGPPLEPVRLDPAPAAPAQVRASSERKGMLVTW